MFDERRVVFAVRIIDRVSCMHWSQVAYDPRQVSYEELLQVFIKGHNPTQADGQGGDLGTQYRSGIYFHTSEQKRAAEDFLKKAQADYKAGCSAFEIIMVRNVECAVCKEVLGGGPFSGCSRRP